MKLKQLFEAVVRYSPLEYGWEKRLIHLSFFPPSKRKDEQLWEYEKKIRIMFVEHLIEQLGISFYHTSDSSYSLIQTPLGKIILRVSNHPQWKDQSCSVITFDYATDLNKVIKEVNDKDNYTVIKKINLLGKRINHE